LSELLKISTLPILSKDLLSPSILVRKDIFKITTVNISKNKTGVKVMRDILSKIKNK